MRKCAACKTWISNDEKLCAKCELESLAKEVQTKPLKAKKYDNAKPDLSLVPRASMDAIARAMGYGATKYGRDNYLEGMEWSRMIAAAMRHLTAFNERQELDSESGLSHLDHALACLAILAEYKERGLGLDNRKNDLTNVSK